MCIILYLHFVRTQMIRIAGHIYSIFIAIYHAYLHGGVLELRPALQYDKICIIFVELLELLIQDNGRI